VFGYPLDKDVFTLIESSLSDRLKALGVKIGTQELPPPKPRDLRGIEHTLAGTWSSNLYGETFVVEDSYPQDYKYGNHPLRIHTPPEIIALWAKEPQLADIRPQEYAFIDIETTGLSGNAGTYAFLIGVGRFQENVFHLAQFFLQDPSAEAAQLAGLDEFTHGCRSLVTFNGKAFDIPVLRTRYRMQGFTFPLLNISHVDLLHLARRLWRERLPSRTLIDLEAQVLNIIRTMEDVPSWVIPQLYLDYLNTGDARFLKSVFYHNAKDVLSMVSLFNHIADLLTDPLNRPETTAIDLYGIAKLYETLHQRRHAVAIYTQSLTLGLPTELHLQTLISLSSLYKQLDDMQAAVPLWEEAACVGHIEACIELAKHYEHLKKDELNALAWTEKALHILNNKEMSRAERLSWQEKIEHRHVRLARKIQQNLKSSH
jgi:uncharacterized protein YprB with RNaseH-like and TPR domain